MLSQHNPNPSINLQQPVTGLMYSQASQPFYGMSQSQPSYTYQPNPSYYNLGYNTGGKIPWQPQVQIPQTSFQVPYPGFGQQNSQALNMQNNPYLGYQPHIPYAGAQRPVSQAIPSYPRYAQPDLNQQFPFVVTLELPDLNRLTNDPINYAPWWPVIPH